LRRWLLIALVLVLPCTAWAAGLGKLTVTSALGQPLAGRIDLVAVQRDQAGTLAARLASPERYQQANLQYLPILNSLRLGIETPPGAQPYIKITSTAPFNEPVVDLLVELAWSSGRISRQYTALIDPPGYGAQREAAAPEPSVEPPEARPLAPPAPIAREPQPEPRAQAMAPESRRPPSMRPAGPEPAQYGPVKRGETLAGIASDVKPEGVTLEQMLVGLYRSNPDAFIQHNMNLVKSGRILRVPERSEVAAITPEAALKEVRVQARDWNSYRRRLAESAPEAKEGSATSGRITARVEEPGAPAPRDVVRLSKGESPGAAGGAGKGQGSAADRLRTLEEESVAREKALAEANDRIAQLEKTIREQQRLLTLKGAPLGTHAAKPGEAAPSTGAPTTAPAAKSATVDKAPASAPAAADKASASKPAPKAKPKVVPPPPPSPSLLDTLFDEPLYLIAALGALVLAVAGVLLGRRRRSRITPVTEPVGRAAPVFPPSPASAAAATDAAMEPRGLAPAADIAPPEEVDPLAEADVYIAYGRDAQAEDILKEALAKFPARQDIQLKLLEIYAARKDGSAFKEVATRLKQQVGASGDRENWNKAAAMGRALDPDEPMYAPSTPVVVASSEAIDLDLSKVAVPGAHAAAPALRPVEIENPLAAEAKPEVKPEAEPEPVAAPIAPDLKFEMPPAAEPAPAPVAVDATPAPATADSHVIDFNLELPKVEPVTATEPAKPVQAEGDAGLDFKLDFGDINLNLEGEAAAQAVAPAKDPHWHDVQQKFDLAKAYEEMGDKEGAREVLQEVLGEGDSEQQEQAKKLLEALA
jgi:pilus assembly protein FimV